ncbi:MAG: arsenical pump-driving ATPase [Pseudomonadota bacterium]|nr:arsenical pump-driving ATPase [Pseudomonadota bacterium]
MKLLQNPPENLFFTGKGGVGKTSSSCAVAVTLADQGKKVLLVSTDPASNIDEIFSQVLSTNPQPIKGVAGLSAMNVDPEKAAEEYREKVIGPYRGVLPDVAIASMEEQLSGACTVEIAAFDQFTNLIGNTKITKNFDHVIFDTAPTGHTLRLLSLPTAWNGYIENTVSGTTCLGPLEGMVEKKDIYEASMKALADKNRTVLVLVSRPEKAALDEAERTAIELGEIGVTNMSIIVNGVFTAMGNDDPIANAMDQRGRDSLSAMPKTLSKLDRFDVPLRTQEILGTNILRQFFSAEDHKTHEPEVLTGALPESLADIIDDLAHKEQGMIMTMGKGGVGKTTIAARIAIDLATRGFNVLLSTTDPAAHVTDAVGCLRERLEVDQIDPNLEVEKYRKQVMETTGAALDDDGRALLEEDLNSPCTEEIAVFQAFARTVNQAQGQIVVLDTAPTGHTILLLDAAEAYHREISRLASDASDEVSKLLPRLRDPNFTRVLICTLAEATPVHEAAELQKDLRRAGIEPYAWIINQSLAPLDIQDPILKARKAQETKYISEVSNNHAKRTILEAWQESNIQKGKSSNAA